MTNRKNALLVLSILFILFFTFLPHSSLGIGVEKGHLNLNPLAMFHFASFSSFIINNIGNVMLFIPFGFTLSMRLPNQNKWRIVGIGCLLSMMIEITQLFMPNRCTDIDDVILNTLGTFLGYLFYFKLKDG
ncbi:glycopeptide antibiotics resistance protein [Pullulanibacillus pueri]|uniref:VanZ-like domain-containing protein n=1 Tax=Pullulanibacillus pueri TaxID=1437324 RepID=A0A8J3ENE7_9BACL|nr:VanZ family protein [Pullulanibacillus pueri]MBM7681790.1 glycopeptide antibiotics resistance protein [Pullulanibacillus pueri]GGH84251.1 hypothetical protein GCM10007096_26900 [Pullulanibacillus pueri]